MQKLWKRLFGLAALGSAVAGVFYYFKKTKDADLDDDDDDDAYVEDFDDVFENEDFDLDNDLKPVSDRGYVPLTPKSTSSETSSEESVSKESEDAKEDSEEKSEEDSSQTTED